MSPEYRWLLCQVKFKLLINKILFTVQGKKPLNNGGN